MPVADGVLEGLLDRAGRAELAALRSQLRSSGYCARPVRLRGSVLSADASRRLLFTTRSEPDGVLRKACGDRREAVCPTCAERYRGDAYQLALAGLLGGKGVPGSVSTHPVLFATLTAPGFGPVHTHRSSPDVSRAACRPRRDRPVCPHGRPMYCNARHDVDDESVGEPLCPECFDYEAAVTWNNSLGRLWRYTTIYLPRRLAALLGISQNQLRREVRISYLKVSEYQRRGLVHLHVLVRLDRAMPAYRADQLRPPSPRYTPELLERALRDTVADVTCPAPESLDGRAIRWGSQLHVQQLAGAANSFAGYLAKYATKSTEQAGGSVYRINPRELEQLGLRPHAHELAATAFRLHASNPDLRLARCAHANGYRGHCLTKSRRYSTTFTALRRAREEWMQQQLARTGNSLGTRENRIAAFRYAGIGHVTAADAYLAAKAAAWAREQRQVAWSCPKQSPRSDKR